MFFAVGQGFVPAVFAGFVEWGWDVGLVDVVDAGAVHADYVEERLAVDVPAGAGSSGHDVGAEVGFSQTFLCGLCGRDQRGACLGDAGGLQVGFAAHDGGDAGGVVAAGVGVVG